MPLQVGTTLHQEYRACILFSEHLKPNNNGRNLEELKHHEFWFSAAVLSVLKVFSHPIKCS